MSRGKHGERLSSLDESVVSYIIQKEKVHITEIKRVFNLTKVQVGFIVRKCKKLAPERVRFSREGKFTVAWEAKKFQESGLMEYVPSIGRQVIKQTWPMDRWEKATCLMNRKLDSLWGVVL